MDFRLGVGDLNNKTPLAKAIKIFNGDKNKEKYYEPRATNARPIMGRFPNVNYESYKRINNPHNIVEAVIIVIIIVIIMIVFGYIWHLHVSEKESDLTYFKQITFWGGAGKKCPGCGKSPCVCSKHEEPIGDGDDEYISGGDPVDVDDDSVDFRSFKKPRGFMI